MKTHPIGRTYVFDILFEGVRKYVNVRRGVFRANLLAKVDLTKLYLPNKLCPAEVPVTTLENL